MDFPWARARRDRQMTAPLLDFGPDGDHTLNEAEEYGSYSSGDSPPTASPSGERRPSPPLTINLEFRHDTSQPAAQSRPRADIDHKIIEAASDFKRKREVYREHKSAYNRTVEKIDSLTRQYDDEKRKAPPYPPKGTWFQQERKQFPQKKAEHDSKLEFIRRRRQVVIDTDLLKAEELLSKAKNAVIEAEAKLQALRRERHGSNPETGKQPGVGH